MKQKINHKLKSPLRGYLGGKYQLANKIIPKIPVHQCYVEPFAGAAWVLFKKEKSKVEVINDINYDVANLYRCIQHHFDAVLDSVEQLIASRDEFNRQMKIAPNTLTDIQRAIRFIFIHRNSFGGKVFQNHFGTATTTIPKFNPKNIRKELSLARDRIQNCYIECLNYDSIISKYDRAKTFFYIDPPYFNCENDYGKNVFCKADFERLANQLNTIKGKFLLSLNDCEEVREIFKDYKIESTKVRYSVMKNKTESFSEVFITNY